MNPIIFLFLGFGGGFALGYKIALDKPKPEEEVPPVFIPPQLQLPSPSALPPLSRISVPPSPIEIPGGNYINNIGWCPPGYSYSLASHMCEPDVWPTGTTGCDDETCDCHYRGY
jgi:hypothetical protein